MNQIKFTVRQIHRKKEKNKHNYQLKKVYLDLEYWLGNPEKLKSVRVKVLPSLLSLH